MTRSERIEALEQRFKSFMGKLSPFQSEQEDSVKLAGSTLQRLKDAFSEYLTRMRFSSYWLEDLAQLCEHCEDAMEYYLSIELFAEFKQIANEAQSLDYEIYVEKCVVGYYDF